MSNEDEMPPRVERALGILLTTIQENNFKKWEAITAISLTISYGISQVFSAEESLGFFTHIQEFSFLDRKQLEKEPRNLNFLKDVEWGEFADSLETYQEAFHLIASVFVEHSIDAGSIILACGGFLSLVIAEIGAEAFMRLTVLQMVALSHEMRESHEEKRKEGSNV